MPVKETKQSGRKTGIDVIDPAPWGTHLCLFYEGKQDLVDILVPYFKTGLENNEFCMWVTSEPLSVQEAKETLKKAVPDLEDYLTKGQIEIISYKDWYTKTGKFEADKVLQGWLEKHDKAVKRGFDGLRLTGNTSWLKKSDWKDFAHYEAVVDSVIRKYRMLAICTYSLGRCRTSDIMDVVSTHQFALIKRKGKWKIIESAERRKAEEALRETKDYLESLINYANAPIIIWNPEFNIIRFNHAFERLTGYAAKETIGKELNMLFPEATRDESLQKIAGTLSGEYWESVEISILCKDGDIRVVLWNSANIYAEDGTTLLSTIAQGVDITERKKAEEALKESKERLELALSAASMGTWRWNIKTDQDTRDANFNSMLGLKAAESTQSVKDFIQYVHPDDRAVVDEEIKRAIRERDIYRIEFRIVRPDGTIYWLSDRGKIYYDQKNEPVYMTGAVFNITERKKAEQSLKYLNEKLIRSNQELQEFIHVASHDLKEPTRKIASFGQMLAESLANKLNNDERENFNFMIDGANRMGELIESVVLYSQVSTEDVQFEQIDLNEIVEQLKSLELAAKLEETNSTISVPEPLPAVKGDPTQIRQLLQNLISNALKYHKKDTLPEVTIRAHKEDNGMVRVDVQDNGIGIKREQCNELFVMFRRLHSQDEYEGMGIGLSICKRIIERHRGEIGIKSTYGKGSTFWFTLPAAGSIQEQQREPILVFTKPENNDN